MTYTLVFSEQSEKDVKFLKKSGNKIVLKKIEKLLKELTQHPFEGTGKPEELKHNLSGYWSRRINREHRIVYRVLETEIEVYILSLKGHY